MADSLSVFLLNSNMLPLLFFPYWLARYTPFFRKSVNAVRVSKKMEK